ncbi:N-acetylmuramoyl-L-alanine amidase [Palleronia caenipelagi]|uniref:Lysozyme n=1 Tax=Palleronia caenipelagi TaxID=2489174 RepID=A0A547PW83_9RHOB|nr:N-acetylmuramoyl-L-alanine amidase [Palleronia caenipelagi]TRD18378.1 lysozyme [Palleronia caenipelagi]
MRPITEIIIHASATRPDWWAGQTTDAKAREIRRWHMEERRWSDIGYHVLIDRDGTVAPGRPIERTGAHVRGHNTGTVGICLLGGHGAASTDRFTDHFTAAQDASLRKLIADLERRFPIRKVTGHNDYAAKGCPGFKVAVWRASKPLSPPAPDAPAFDRLAAALTDAIRLLQEILKEIRT